MPTITYTHFDGRSDAVDVAEGTSVMRAALEQNVGGIVGECGGQAMCATCHVFVSDDQGLPEVSEDEDEMLDCTIVERADDSRLGCQLVAGVHFDTIHVRLPETQV